MPEALVPKFASLFGAPPIVLGEPLIFWGPPNQVWGTYFWFGGPPIGIWGPPLGAPQSFGGSQSGPQNITLQNYDLNRLGAPQSNLGDLLGEPQSVWGPPNRTFGGTLDIYLQHLLKTDDFDRKPYAYTYKVCRN